MPLGRRVWAPAVAFASFLAFLAVAAPASAEAPGDLPRLVGDPAADGALDWIADPPGVRVDEDGCVHYRDKCRPATAKLVARTVAHVGADPARWPDANRSVLGWMLAHADDLRDAQLRRCEDDPTYPRPDVCDQRKVLSLAKTVLGFRAAGVDVRSVPLPDGGDRDLVAELLENRTSGQFGSPAYVNDDVWALVALHAARHDGPAVEDAADAVESAQHDDGSVGYTPDDRSVDTTAAAVMALAPVGRDDAVDDALGYLEETQLRSGEDRACWGLREGRDATAGSTAWAVQGLVAAGEDPASWDVNGTTPLDCLLGFRTDGGGYANSHRRGQDGPVLQATLQAPAALAWTPYGALRAPLEPEERVLETRVGETVAVEAPHGFLRTADGAADALEARPEDPGNRTYRGFTWGPDADAAPRPLEVHVRVLPPVPAPPTVRAPDVAYADEPVPVQLVPADRWAHRLTLTLPDGTTRTGADHTLDLPPGLHEVLARAVNTEGEASHPARRTLLVRAPAPTLSVDGPTEAAPDEPVTLQAEATAHDGSEAPVRWEAPDGTRLGDGPTLTLEPRPGGTRTVTAVAGEPGGPTSRASHTVAWRPLVIEIHGPHRTANGSVPLQADVTPADGASVTWTVDGQPAADGTEVRLDLDPGTHRIRAVAALGNASADASHEVTIPPPPSGNASGADEGPDPEASGGPSEAGDSPGAPGSGDPADEPGPGAPDQASPATTRGTPAPGAAALVLAGLAAALRGRP